MAAVSVTQKPSAASATVASAVTPSSAAIWARKPAPARRHSVPSLPQSAIHHQPTESCASPRRQRSRKNSLIPIDEHSSVAVVVGTPRTAVAAEPSHARTVGGGTAPPRCRRRSVAVMSHLYTSNETPRVRRLSSVDPPVLPANDGPTGDKIIDEYVREVDEAVLRGGLGVNPETNVAASSEFEAVMSQMSVNDD